MAYIYGLGLVMTGSADLERQHGVIFSHPDVRSRRRHSGILSIYMIYPHPAHIAMQPTVTYISWASLRCDMANTESATFVLHELLHISLNYVTTILELYVQAMSLLSRTRPITHLFVSSQSRVSISCTHHPDLPCPENQVPSSFHCHRVIRLTGNALDCINPAFWLCFCSETCYSRY